MKSELSLVFELNQLKLHNEDSKHSRINITLINIERTFYLFADSKHRFQICSFIANMSFFKYVLLFQNMSSTSGPITKL